MKLALNLGGLVGWKTWTDHLSPTSEKRNGSSRSPHLLIPQKIGILKIFAWYQLILEEDTDLGVS